MHPIIALWSHPRSMSTATERIMRERGDLDCAHEPFMYDYYVHRQVRKMPHFDVQDGHPTSYGAIRDMLLARGEQQPVFFKDMAYYVMPHILEDAEFCNRVTHCFLVRNPMASITSYHKLDPEVTLEEIGLEAQLNLLEGLRDRTGKTPAVICAEDVRNDPTGVIGALWRACGLPPAPQAFDWQNETPKDWGQVEGWHGDVSRSSGIRPITEEERQKQALAFAERSAAAPHLQQYLDHHSPSYNALAALALKPAAN